MGNVTGTKTGARHSTRYSGEPDRIVNHPEYGVMRFKSGWLSHIEEPSFKMENAEVIEYREGMRVKGKTKIQCLKQDRTQCDRCGKTLRESMTLDGLCEVCYRATEIDIEDEINAMREHWRNGGMQLRTGSSLVTGSADFQRSDR